MVAPRHIFLCCLIACAARGHAVELHNDYVSASLTAAGELVGVAALFRAVC